MDKMNYFQIQNSGRIGTVPVEYTTWPDVEVMLLDRNSLTGTIHTELGNADFIRYIFLGDNDLSGTIPSELGKLTRLEGKLISFCLELRERNSEYYSRINHNLCFELLLPMYNGLDLKKFIWHQAIYKVQYLLN